MDPDPVLLFINDLLDANKKLIKKKSFTPCYFLKVHLHHFSKIKSQKSKTVEIKVFLTIFLIDRRIRIQEAQKHVDPDSDPDPQHWS